MKLEKEEAREYALRGQKRRHENSRICIEGEYVTRSEIAARLGLSLDATGHRLKYRQSLPGPVTWDGMREKAKRKGMKK